jgi:hypothetical protein
MAASKTETVNVNVMRYTNGECVGAIWMNAASWERYAGREHPDYQWPEGIARAGDVLAAKVIEELGLEQDTVIFLS